MSSHRALAPCIASITVTFRVCVNVVARTRTWVRPRVVSVGGQEGVNSFYV